MPAGEDDSGRDPELVQDPEAVQHVVAERDAYAAGMNQVVVNLPPARPPQQPTAAQRLWGDVPARNLGFTGREALLRAVRAALTSGDRAVVQALRGMGGVGKTQLAIEYAHRHANDYGVVWWIAAERPDLIAGQFASLGAALGCAAAGLNETEVRQTVLGELRNRDRWLLVFDNAVRAEDIARWMPGGGGHVLITSRAHGWDELAVPVDIDVLGRGESVTLLRSRIPGLSKAEADLIAETLGDLPLAIAQAAAYMTESGASAADYVRLVRTRAVEILEWGRPASYPVTLAAVTQLALDQLATDSPAAAQAVRICAFLAPEPVPAAWFPHAAGRLPDPLSAIAADPLAWGRALAQISGRALVRVDRRGLTMHRLTQAIIRTLLTADAASAAHAQANALVTDALLELNLDDAVLMIRAILIGWAVVPPTPERRLAATQVLVHLQA